MQVLYWQSLFYEIDPGASLNGTIYACAYVGGAAAATMLAFWGGGGRVLLSRSAGRAACVRDGAAAVVIAACCAAGLWVLAGAQTLAVAGVAFVVYNVVAEPAIPWGQAQVATAAQTQGGGEAPVGPHVSIQVVEETGGGGGGGGGSDEAARSSDPRAGGGGQALCGELWSEGAAPAAAPAPHPPYAVLFAFNMLGGQCVQALLQFAMGKHALRLGITAQFTVFAGVYAVLAVGTAAVGAALWRRRRPAAAPV